MSVTEVLGIRYQNVTIAQAAEDIIGMAKTGGSHYIVTPNPEISESCMKDPTLAKAVSHADYAVPDGIGVVIAAKILGKPLKERVGGYDVACALFPMMEKEGLSLFLLGAKPGIAEKAAENIKRKYPSLRIVGVRDGYFQEDAEVVQAVNAAQPDILFVALGSPKQELWMYRNQKQLNTGVMMGLGGSFDIFAGAAKRAPAFFIRFNLEWFYRLLRQPTRFIRMLKLPRYLLRAIGCAIFKKWRVSVNES